MMGVLAKYEQISGQMINKSKCFFYLHEKISAVQGHKIRKWTGINQRHVPFTYLGCPAFYGRKKLAYCEDLLGKISRRIMC